MGLILTGSVIKENNICVLLKIAKKKKKNNNNCKLGCHLAQFKNNYEKDHSYTQKHHSRKSNWQQQQNNRHHFYINKLAGLYWGQA